MSRLIFTLILLLLTGVIYLLAGRNRRQLRRVPEGMALLCQPPGQRYVLYALGVLVVLLVLGFSALYFLDGAPEEARPMWLLCVVLAVLLLILTLVCGRVMAKRCAYFDMEKLILKRPFQKAQTFRWEDIRRIDGSFDRAVSLYSADGERILTADIGMVNYALFCKVLKKNCPERTAEYERAQSDDAPGGRVLRYGGEYYVLAVLGLLILLMYLASLVFTGGDLRQALRADSPSQWFSLLFAPVCGAASAVLLFVLCNTAVRYSDEGLVLKFPLRAERELFWRDIRRFEAVPGRDGWKKLRLYTSGGVYRLNLNALSHGRDGFMTELLSMAEKYQIPCAKTAR